MLDEFDMPVEAFGGEELADDREACVLVWLGAFDWPADDGALRRLQVGRILNGNDGLEDSVACEVAWVSQIVDVESKPRGIILKQSSVKEREAISGCYRVFWREEELFMNVFG